MKHQEESEEHMVNNTEVSIILIGCGNDGEAVNHKVGLTQNILTFMSNFRIHEAILKKHVIHDVKQYIHDKAVILVKYRRMNT